MAMAVLFAEPAGAKVPVAATQQAGCVPRGAPTVLTAPNIPYAAMYEPGILTQAFVTRDSRNLDVVYTFKGPILLGVEDNNLKFTASTVFGPPPRAHQNALRWPHFSLAVEVKEGHAPTVTLTKGSKGLPHALRTADVYVSAPLAGPGHLEVRVPLSDLPHLGARFRWSATSGTQDTFIHTARITRTTFQVCPSPDESPWAMSFPNDAGDAPTLALGSGGSSTTTPTPTTTSTPPAQSAGGRVLAPQSLPAKTALCSTAITETADGNYTPLLCDNGPLNVNAWQAYASFKPNPGLLALPRAADLTTVRRAACTAHAQSLTLPQVSSMYTLVATYNGWLTQGDGWSVSDMADYLPDCGKD